MGGGVNGFSAGRHKRTLFSGPSARHMTNSGCVCTGSIGPSGCSISIPLSAFPLLDQGLRRKPALVVEQAIEPRLR